MHRLKHIKLNSRGKEVLRQRLSGPGRTNFVGAASAVALALLALVILSPTVSEGANAEEITDSSATTYSAVVNPVLSIALDNQVRVEFTPTASGDFKNSPANLSISTNNTAGYRILLATSGGNALENTSGAGSIPSITTTTPAADFPKDSWGYSLVRTGEAINTYSAIPSISTEAKKVDTGDVTAGLTDNYTLNFGTKVTNRLPAGVYNKELIVSVVANPAELRSLTDLTTMQDMNSKICANTPTGTETQLQDSRDHKWYWVAKLKDGNCWMTQNLDYDIPSSPVPASQTDIASDWTSPQGATKTDNHYNVGVDSNSSYSWDLGNYRLKDPNGKTRCDAPNNTNLGTACSDDVATTTSLDNSAAIEDTNLHYHVGNYYQFNSATAGTGSAATTDDANASSSICPKNWTLPKNSGKSSFANLFSTSSVTTVEQLVASQIRPTKAGIIATSGDGYLILLNDYGYYRSATSHSSERAYYACFSGNDNELKPSANNDFAAFGMPVRCLAR